jgi:cell division protease FtsH
VAHVAAQERLAVVVAELDGAEALVLALLARETLDKEEVAEIFVPLRRRAARPAWTGSPDRIPSTIPPIEIPQEIRDRAKINGTNQQDRSAPVLTPPGSGGDVHGDPGVQPPSNSGTQLPT